MMMIYTPVLDNCMMHDDDVDDDDDDDDDVD